MAVEEPVDIQLAIVLMGFVDDYGRLLERDRERMLAVIESRQATMGRLILHHLGRGNGGADQVCAVFRSLGNAFGCAVAIQKAMRQANRTEPEGRWVRMRMSLAIGDALRRDGALAGRLMNLAAHLAPLAEPDGIVVPLAVRDLLRGRPGVTFSSLGRQHLQDRAPPAFVFRVITQT